MQLYDFSQLIATALEKGPLVSAIAAIGAIKTFINSHSFLY
jgi:hypothetical protein